MNQNWLNARDLLPAHDGPGLGSPTRTSTRLVLWKFSIYILAAVALYFTSRIYGV